MSIRSGFQTTFLKYVAPATTSNVSYQNGGQPITTLPAGRYLVSIVSTIKPTTAGASISVVSQALSTGAPYGSFGAVGLMSKFNEAPAGADVVIRDCFTGIISLTAVSTPIFFYLLATTSAGTWQSATGNTYDSAGCSITFLKVG